MCQGITPRVEMNVEVLSGLIWAGEKHRFSYLKINPFKEARKVVYSWGKDKNP